MPGYQLNAEDKSLIDEKFLCSKCEEVLREPVQTIACGHRYCRSCVDQIIGSEDKQCVLDGTPIETGQFFPDKFVAREILSLRVGCVYLTTGCPWKGELRELEIHASDCTYATISCPHEDCGVELKRSDLAAHLQNDCVWREVDCQYCKLRVIFCKMEDHERTCTYFPVQCPDCKRENVPRCKLNEHRDPVSGNCKEVATGCIFQRVGCQQTRAMKKEERDKHEKKSHTQHQKLALRHAFKLEEDLTALRNEVSCFSGLRQVTERLTTEQASLREQIQKEVQSLVIKMQALTTRLTAMEQGSGQTSLDQNSRLLVEHLGSRTAALEEDFNRKVRNLEAKCDNKDVILTELKRENQALKHKIEFLERQQDLTRDVMRRLERRIDSQDHMLTLKNLAMADMEERMREQDNASYNGVLLWKIPDIARRRQDAVTGKQTSFYSPAFYTSRHGYRMCARMYLNGDGMGKGTHLSAFFVLMRGEYDALMPWPFRQKVTISLINQGGTENKSDTFLPDPQSSSFKRPTTEMNIASGFPMLCSITDLDAYVRDDTIFLKVVVDTTGL